jgi:hypothetical protein
VGKSVPKRAKNAAPSGVPCIVEWVILNYDWISVTGGFSPITKE